MDLAAVLSHTIDQRRGALACQVSWTRPRQPVFIRGNHEELPDVFVDLLVNANKAMAGMDCGCITVSLDERRDEGVAVVVVEDNGPGVPPDLEETLFEPFVGRSQSTGLGLAIIQQRVIEHEGTISHVALSAGGASFRIRLPLWPSEVS